MRSGLALCAALLATSCSLGVRGPSQAGSQCDDAYGAPIVDTIVATGALVGGIVAISSSKSGTSESVGGYADLAALGVLVAIPYAISAAIGYSRVSSCRSSRQRS